MPIITSSGFSIPHIFAESYISELNSSANRPLLIRGKDMHTAISSEYILKLNNSMRMSSSAAMRELIASLIALELSIDTPYPAFIEISSEFAESFIGNINYQRVSKSLGLNFGTKFLNNFWVYKENLVSINKLYKELQKIFIFDMLIDNTDRTELKPNILTNEDKVSIIDHEISFAFSFLIGLTINKPWEISEYEIKAANDHILFKVLRKKPFLCDDFMDSFSNLNDVFWDKIKSLIPLNWLDSKFDLIRKHISLKVQNLHLYKKNIQRLLS